MVRYILFRENVCSILRRSEELSTWYQPQLNELTGNGVFGGSTFAVRGATLGTNYAWKAVDKNTSTYWTPTANNQGDKINVPFDFYSPKPLYVSSIYSTGYQDSNWVLKTYKICACNDDNSWVDLTSTLTATDGSVNANLTNVNEGYKYWRIQPVTVSTYGFSMKELTITAQVYRRPSENVPVCGNGLAMGFTDGTSYFGSAKNTSQRALCLPMSAYGQSVGTTNSNVNDGNNKVIGVTPDPDYSGIVADISNLPSFQPTSHIIKF